MDDLDNIKAFLEVNEFEPLKIKVKDEVMASYIKKYSDFIGGEKKTSICKTTCGRTQEGCQNC